MTCIFVLLVRKKGKEKWSKPKSKHSPGVQLTDSTEEVSKRSILSRFFAASITGNYPDHCFVYFSIDIEVWKVRIKWPISVDGCRSHNLNYVGWGDRSSSPHTPLTPSPGNELRLRNVISIISWVISGAAIIRSEEESRYIFDPPHDRRNPSCRRLVKQIDWKERSMDRTRKQILCNTRLPFPFNFMVVSVKSKQVAILCIRLEMNFVPICMEHVIEIWRKKQKLTDTHYDEMASIKTSYVLTYNYCSRSFDCKPCSEKGRSRQSERWPITPPTDNVVLPTFEQLHT